MADWDKRAERAEAARMADAAARFKTESAKEDTQEPEPKEQTSNEKGASATLS